MKTRTSAGSHRIAPPRIQNTSEWAQQVYPELRGIAGRLFHAERAGHTLQPTALVHEAVIRLLEHGPETYASRAHFFGVVSRAMRQVLVEHARGRGAKKRGGDWRRVPIEEADIVAMEGPDWVALDEALQHLENFDSKLCRIVELRIFGATTIKSYAPWVRERQQKLVRSVKKMWGDIVSIDARRKEKIG